MKITADGVDYPFPDTMTMGELRQLKRHFDLPRPGDLDLGNIDHIAGLLFVAMRRQSPNVPVDAIIARIDATEKVRFEGEDGDGDRPTKAAGDGDSGN